MLSFHRRGAISMGNSVSPLGPLPVKPKPAVYNIYIGIAFMVIFFNLIAIFGLDSLLHDDPAWYKMVLSGEFPRWMFKYNLLSPFTEWTGWTIMAYSPHLARGLYVLLLMVPLSCCFYYLYRFRFGFPWMTAFTAAVLPTILPMQSEIPAGINMSYVLWGLLISVLSLILGFHYLEKNTPKNWIRLMGAILSYLAATQIMEQALFLFPPFVLAFWGYKKFDKKNIYLISFFALIAFSRFIQMVLLPRVPIKKIPLDMILKRILTYFKWGLPFGDIDPVYPVIIFLGIVSVGFILYLKQPGDEPKFNRIFLYILFLGWAISTGFVFIFMSRYYIPRYVFISSFGLNALFVFSLYVILKKLFHGKFKLHIPVFAALILFSGISRYFTLNETYTPVNTDFSIIQRDLNKMSLPMDSQIVIVDIKGIAGGWERSSGYLQFALKRKDVTGLLGPIDHTGYYNFDNHFNRRIKGWEPRYNMTGLSLKQPVFLFRLDKKTGELNQLEYTLQWRGEKKDAPWTILKVDKITGKILPLVSGTGMEEYVSTLQELKKRGIPHSEILWGGPPTKAEQIRLEKGA